MKKQAQKGVTVAQAVRGVRKVLGPKRYNLGVVPVRDVRDALTTLTRLLADFEYGDLVVTSVAAATALKTSIRVLTAEIAAS